ncbi:MAG: tetraacyldisaccharide 4'-kinase [Bacteroidetes bacterium]|nr:MAG: tetraacyldisaccharide 4'-kinase [Bacteroidota bacterium]
MNFVRKILFPIVPIYYLVTWLRNWFYDTGIFKSKSYNFPLICVGNLSAGGTGKTPMIEYLIQLLSSNYNIATLSRGYKRNTKGFYIADKNASAEKIGDEPFQMLQKFDDVIVSVDENRQNGIAQLQQLQNVPEIILLDDAFQHRKVSAGLNILLTTYAKLYIDDFVLPTGNLREPKSGAKRAQIIVVTKCPINLHENEKSKIIRRLKPLSRQEVFFSTIKYSETVYSLKTSKPLIDLQTEKFTLVTGIANPKPILSFLNNCGYNFEHLNFKDHHSFTESELKLLNTKPFILTTEKDFMRLKDNIDIERLFYLPIEIEISDKEKFDNIINEYLSGN